MTATAIHSANNTGSVAFVAPSTNNAAQTDHRESFFEGDLNGLRETVMTDIFVSYSRADHDAINLILTALNENGLQYWLDQSSILPTMEFNEEILRGLNSFPWFLIIMTPRKVRPLMQLPEKPSETSMELQQC